MLQTTITPYVDRIVRPAEAATILGRSLVSIWRDVKAGRLGPKLKIGPNAVGFRMSALTAHMDGLETATTENMRPVATGAKRGRPRKIIALAA
jgi:predicted DNA-binding transcriptional regulator AlpA